MVYDTAAVTDDEDDNEGMPNNMTKKVLPIGPVSQEYLLANPNRLLNIISRRLPWPSST